MGCNCGKRGIFIDRSNNKFSRCPKCGSVMGQKQVYVPNLRRYRRLFECPRCKHKIDIAK